MDTEILKDFGLSDREIRVYIALNELGVSTSGPIAVKAKLSQAKVYETLGRLQERGLASYTFVSKTKHFQPSSPKFLLDSLNERKKRMTSLVEELEQKRTFASKGQISRIHEGLKALRLLFDDLVDNLKSGDFYYAFAFREHYYNDSNPSFLLQVHKKLEQSGIKDLAIAHNTISKKINKVYKDNKNIQIKFTARTYPLGLVIVPGKVIQLLWGEYPTAIEIVSTQISNQYQKFFEDEWKSLK